MNQKFCEKIIPVIFVTFLGCFFVTITYLSWFQKPLQVKRYINEIVKMKIDSCHIEKDGSHSSYKFFIGDKYRATIDSTKYVPFEHQADVDIDVRNIEGEIVVLNWSNKCWKSDIDRLSSYLTDYAEEYQRMKIIKSNYLKIDSLTNELIKLPKNENFIGHHKL